MPSWDGMLSEKKSRNFYWENYPPLAVLNDLCSLEQRFKQSLRYHYRRIENILGSIESQIGHLN